MSLIWWDNVPGGADLDQPWFAPYGCTCCVHFGPCPRGDCREERCTQCGEDEEEE